MRTCNSRSIEHHTTTHERVQWDNKKCYATEMYEDEACSDGSLNLSDGDGERGRAEEGRGGGLVGELGFDGDERNGGGGLLVVAHFSLSTDHVPITFPRQEAAVATGPLAATR